MAMFILETEMLENIRQLYKQKEKDINQLKMNVEEQLIQSGALSKKDNEMYQMDDTASIMLESLLTWDAHMHCYNEGGDTFDYYLKEDQIVLTSKQNKKLKCLLLPTITYAIGSIANMVWDHAGYTENNNHEVTCTDVINDNNYLQLLSELVQEKEYTDALNASEHTLFLHGESIENDSNFYMVIKFIDGVPFYYKQEENKVTYGKNNRDNLVNNISHWLLYTHRKLISNLLEETNK